MSSLKYSFLKETLIVAACVMLLGFSEKDFRLEQTIQCKRA